MTFSHFAELTTVNKPKDEFYLEITYVFSYSRYLLVLLQKLIQNLNFS